MSDFNPLVHLELEEQIEINDDTADQIQIYDDSEENANVFKHEVQYVVELNRLWLKAEPDGMRFFDEIKKCLLEGMECLKVFERRSRNPDLKKYETVLEDWDDRVC